MLTDLDVRYVNPGTIFILGMLFGIFLAAFFRWFMAEWHKDHYVAPPVRRKKKRARRAELTPEERESQRIISNRDDL